MEVKRPEDVTREELPRVEGPIIARNLVAHALRKGRPFEIWGLDRHLSRLNAFSSYVSFFAPGGRPIGAAAWLLGALERGDLVLVQPSASACRDPVCPGGGDSRFSPAANLRSRELPASSFAFAGARNEKPSGENPPEELRLIKHSLGLDYRYSDGEPIPDIPYKVTLADGSVREGRLDARGKANLPDVPPGAATIEYEPEDLDTPVIQLRAKIKSALDGMVGEVRERASFFNEQLEQELSLIHI